MNTVTRSVFHTSMSSARPSLLLGVATVVLSAFALTASTARAQSTVPLPLASLSEGARVRITAVHGAAGLPSDAAFIGTVQRVTADSVSFVAQTSAPITLALSQIETLQAAIGVRRYGKRGLGIGLATGVLGGGLFGYATGDGYFFTKDEAMLFGATVFGVLGAAAGGLIGLSITGDAWRPVALGTLSDRVLVRPLLGATHAGISVQVRW